MVRSSEHNCSSLQQTKNRSWLRNAMLLFDAKPCETVYATRFLQDIPDAAICRVGTLMWDGPYNVSSVLPDLASADVGDGAKRLLGLKLGAPLGCLAEVWSCKGSRRHEIRGHFWSGGQLPGRDLHSRSEVWFLGRYFPTSDGRHHKHPLSRRILRLKTQKDVVLTEVLARGISSVNEALPVSAVTRVPPRPGEKTDRLNDLVQEACISLDRGSKGLRPAPELLTCTRDYPSQKQAGSPSNRSRNVADCFTANGNLAGQHILLCDDIYTTGYTLAECTRALLKAGADRVTALAFAVTQRAVVLDSSIPSCPGRGCGGEVVMRWRKRDGRLFWGCSKWAPSDSECRRTTPFDQGLDAWNEANKVPAASDLDDVPF